ncbi:hypothetical protein Bca52824_023463 [Brassica carinata]|uniref:Uncharacterized protein n=1 Tax=Brassica carinata TaxID=52824 RepID=A0A8X7VIH6_BRACI|nr:hypothetical protein Bca52824_023463 [Brassica carinata]
MTPLDIDDMSQTAATTRHQHRSIRIGQRREGFARGIDGDAIEFLKTTSKTASKNFGDEAYIRLQEHASSFTRRELVQETYTKDEINKMFTGLLGERMGKALHGKEFRGGHGQASAIFATHEPWLDKFNIDDGVTSTSIDMKPAPSTTYSKHEIDESLGNIWKEVKKAEARLSSKLTKTLDKEVEELDYDGYYAAEAEKFQRQLDYQAASIVIDELNLTSIVRRLTEIDAR